MTTRFYFHGLLPSSENPEIERAAIDSTAGTDDKRKLIVTDDEGLIDPSFLTERVQDIVGDNLVTNTTSIVWTYTDAAGTLEADVQDEYVQDVVGAMLTDSSTIDFTYDDGTGTFTAIVPINAINDTHIDWGTGANQVNTDDMPEGSTNLYFTDERAQDAVGGILTDSSEIDFTYSDATPSITASIVAGSIDETKLDTSVNASLDLADSSVQPGDSVTDLLPPGSDTQVIINDGGSFAGASGLTWDGWLGINTTTQFAPGSDSIAVLVDDDTSLSFGTTTTGTFTHSIRWWDGVTNVAEIEIDHALKQFEIATTGAYTLQFRSGGFIACNVDTNQDWDFQAGDLTTTGAVTASDFESTVTTGTAPLVVASTTLVSNLNSDLLDGQHGSYYLARANHTGTQTLATISDAGTAAAGNTGTSGNTIPFLDGANTWSALQTFSLNEASPTTNTVLMSNPNAGGSAQVRISLQRGSDAGSGLAKGGVFFATGTSFGIADYEARPQRFFTGTTAGSATERFTILANGNVGVGASSPTVKLDINGVVKTATYTVATLPTGAAGHRAFVTDANATTFASVVAGGGANGVPVFHDGANWRIG